MCRLITTNIKMEKESKPLKVNSIRCPTPSMVPLLIVVVAKILHIRLAVGYLGEDGCNVNLKTVDAPLGAITTGGKL